MFLMFLMFLIAMACHYGFDQVDEILKITLVIFTSLSIMCALLGTICIVWVLSWKLFFKRVPIVGEFMGDT
jgi:hypothetical protein